ncbi:MAG: CHAT domain-containing protein [Ignavibacteriae bacterium]|nr:CHAT domain-containing protein [Ignavibacteriota bacterium]
METEGKTSSIVLIVSVVAFCMTSALDCGRSAKDKQEAADQSSSRAQLLFNQQEYVKAVESIREAIVLNSELNRDSALGENYFLFARCQRMLADYESALVSFKTALEHSRLLPDNQLERKIKIAHAEFQYSLGDHEAAVSTASDVTATAKLYGNAQDTYQALRIIAKAFHKMRKYDREVRTLSEAAQIDSQAFTMQNRGELLRLLMQSQIAVGNDQKARELFKHIRMVAHTNNDSSALAYAYLDWGKYQQFVNRSDSALQSFSQALGMLSSRSDRSLHIAVLSTLGHHAYRAKRFVDARRYFSDALHIVRQVNDVVMEQLLNLMIIACDWKSHSDRSRTPFPELVERCSKLLSACQQVGFRGGEACVLFLMGKLAEARGETTEALQQYEASLQLYEKSQGSFDEDEILNDFIDLIFVGEQSGWYDAPLKLYCSMNKTREVFTLVERKNLHELASFFSPMTFQIADTALNHAMANLRRKQKALRLLIHDIHSELATGTRRTTVRIEALSKLFPLRVSELTAATNELGKMNGSFQWLTAPNQLMLSSIQSTLPATSTMLEFVPLANELCILIVQGDTAFLSKVSIPQQRLLSLIREYNRLISDPRLDGTPQQFDRAISLQRISELSSVLSNIIIHPLVSRLNNVSTLYVVLPAEFEWFPLHTLRAKGKPLIESVTISYLPSAAALLFSSKQEKFVQEVVGFGHQGTSNWDVEYELKDIRGFYTEAKLLFGTSASLDQLAKSNYDLLHIAAEFTLDARRANNSVMQLSDGKTPFGLREATLKELLTVSMPPSMIISNISAMPGGLWRYVPMALLASGTRTLILTMWQGERKSKKYFGEIFYTNVMTGVPSGEAYQQAIVAMATKSEFSQPHRWGLYFRYGK